MNMHEQLPLRRVPKGRPCETLNRSLTPRSSNMGPCVPLILFTLVMAIETYAQTPGVFVYGKATDLLTGSLIYVGQVSLKEANADTNSKILVPLSQGQYELNLAQHKIYEVRFDAPGKISKYVVIDTRGVPPDLWAEGYGMNLDFGLLDSIPGQDLSQFEAPYGIATYNRVRRHFIYDMAITKVMRKHTAALLKKINRKMVRPSSR